MPVVGITAAGIRIFSSTGDVLFNGTLLAPISAGDRLRVEVEVLDILGVRP
jgi:acyl dehydratase